MRAAARAVPLTVMAALTASMVVSPADPPREHPTPPTGQPVAADDAPVLADPLASLTGEPAPASSPPSEPAPSPLTPEQEQVVLAGLVDDPEPHTATQEPERPAPEPEPERGTDVPATPTTEHEHEDEQPESSSDGGIELGSGAADSDSSSQDSGRNVWDDLADCESGNWVNGGSSFETDSARWHLNGTDERAQPLESWHSSTFYGGVQFTLKSWAWAADVGGHDVNPNPANNSREQQIAVAETLKSLQGPGAWPVCGPKVGLK